ncbi:hypothetical protein J6590_095414 [Homalodisca vitripennis]|nr:hypothetical protein J6590_095414 [Homalodisca vitripennis]
MSVESAAQYTLVRVNNEAEGVTGQQEPINVTRPTGTRPLQRWRWSTQEGSYLQSDNCLDD